MNEQHKPRRKAGRLGGRLPASVAIGLRMERKKKSNAVISKKPRSTNKARWKRMLPILSSLPFADEEIASWKEQNAKIDPIVALASRLSKDDVATIVVRLLEEHGRERPLGQLSATIEAANAMLLGTPFPFVVSVKESQTYALRYVFAILTWANGANRKRSNEPPEEAARRKRERFKELSADLLIGLKYANPKVFRHLTERKVTEALTLHFEKKRESNLGVPGFLSKLSNEVWTAGTLRKVFDEF